MSQNMAMPLETFEALRLAAIESAKKAYAPYSKFRVGVAILGEDDKIYSGCNVENSSYGLTVCAERNAVARAIVNGIHSFKAAVIYTPTDQPTSPCGACRQVLNEFSPEMTIISICQSKLKAQFTLKDLLPRAFGPHQLET